MSEQKMTAEERVRLASDDADECGWHYIARIAKKHADAAVAELTKERDEYLYASVQWMERARNVERERDEALQQIAVLSVKLSGTYACR